MGGQADSYRAVQADALGPIETYRLSPLPRQPLRAGQVRVRNVAAGVSYVDVLMATGGYQLKAPVPYVPGLECSGTIIEVAPDVDRRAIGDRVAVATGMGGGHADEVVVPWASTIPIPDNLPLDRAGSAYVNYQSVYHALVQRGRIAAGETVLVLGASGGAGTAAIELAKALGATVIAAASTEAKRAYALEVGADTAIDVPGSEGWRDAVKAACGGRGPDIVFDPVGGAATEPAFRSLAWNGRLLVFGFVGGLTSLPTNLPLLKGAELIGVDARQFRQFEPETADANLKAVNALIAEGKLTPRIDLTFPLDRFAEAMATATDRNHVGRVAILMEEG